MFFCKLNQTLFQKPAVATMIEQAQKAEYTTVSIQESLADVKIVDKIMTADKSDSDSAQGAGGDSKGTNTSGLDSNEKSETMTDTETSGVQESSGDSKTETT